MEDTRSGAPERAAPTTGSAMRQFAAMLTTGNLALLVFLFDLSSHPLSPAAFGIRVVSHLEDRYTRVRVVQTKCIQNLAHSANTTIPNMPPRQD